MTVKLEVMLPKFQAALEIDIALQFEAQIAKQNAHWP